MSPEPQRAVAAAASSVVAVEDVVAAVDAAADPAEVLAEVKMARTAKSGPQSPAWGASSTKARSNR